MSEGTEEAQVYEFDSLEEERLRRTGIAVCAALVVHFGLFAAVAIASWGPMVVPPPPESGVKLIDEKPKAETDSVKVEPPKDALPDFEDQTVLNEDKSSMEAGAPAEMDGFKLSDHYETDDDAEGHGARGDPNALGKLNNLAMEIDNFAGGVSGVNTIHGGGFGHGTQERYGNRGPGGQINLTLKHGGNRSTQEAVRMALIWLSRHQSDDGRWDSDGFDANCKSGRCTGKGGAEWDVGLTGLCLEAFLGHGDTHIAKGPFQANVMKAIDFLKQSQNKGTGCFADESVHAYTYNHAIATYAMAEAYGMTGDPSLQAPVEKAVKYLLEVQNPGKAWRYRNYNKAKGVDEEGEGINDTSVTGWVVMALHAAEEAGIAIPASAYEGANVWLDEVMDREDYRVTFGYTQARKFVYRQPYVTTAAGALIRQFTNQAKGLDGAIAKLTEHLPDGTGKVNYYEWYYGTLVLFQTQGDPWKAWNDALKKSVKHVMVYKDGDKTCDWGSADPAKCTWGESGGRVYATACIALCMEVYYRYKVLDSAGKPRKLLPPSPSESKD